ncbi:MAG: type II toxin-antitoxin system RelE/ParE family toxin [Patescibacteria group bacterium]
MSWHIHVAETAAKQIKRLPQAEAEKIEAAIDTMMANPFAGDIKKIKGEENTWRRRVGSYRISYEVFVNKRFVHIFEVKRRTSNTY